MNTDATLKLMIYGALSVPAVFNEQDIRVQFYETAETGEMSGMRYESAMPYCVCYPSDVASAVQDDEIIIDGVAYYIVEISRRKGGHTKMRLSEVPVNG